MNTRKTLPETHTHLKIVSAFFVRPQNLPSMSCQAGNRTTSPCSFSRESPDDNFYHQLETPYARRMLKRVPNCFDMCSVLCLCLLQWQTRFTALIASWGCLWAGRCSGMGIASVNFLFERWVEGGKGEVLVGWLDGLWDCDEGDGVM